MKSYARAFVMNLRQKIAEANTFGNLIFEWHKKSQHGLNLAEESLRTRILSFVNSMMVSESEFWLFKYSPSKESPILYSSIYALLTKHLLNDLSSLNGKNARDWANYILDFQCKDGLFRDPTIDNDLFENDSVDWWGSRHLTLHALMALVALDVKANPLTGFLSRFYIEDHLINWLESLNWGSYPENANTCNKVQNLGAFLQYSRDYHRDLEAGKSLNVLFRWLDDHMDHRTGTWTKCDASRYSNLCAMVSSYHLWCLYFYDSRALPKNEMIDLLLSLQQWPGGFGPKRNSTACDDIDAIDPLCRLAFLTNYREAEVKKCLGKALRWIVFNMNPDGGFSFSKHAPLFYGHDLMASGPDESAMFPTWFRTLTLAYLYHVIAGNPTCNIEWQFIKSPGHQFWISL